MIFFEFHPLVQISGFHPQGIIMECIVYYYVLYEV